MLFARLAGRAGLVWDTGRRVVRLPGGVCGHRPEGAERFADALGERRLLAVLVEPTVDRHTEDGHRNLGGQRRDPPVAAVTGLWLGLYTFVATVLPTTFLYPTGLL